MNLIQIMETGQDLRGRDQNKLRQLGQALYHISGATSFTFECPHGIDDPRACQVSLEQILDIQLTLYEAMMQSTLEAKEH